MMKSTFTILAGIASLASTLPTADSEPVRILPYSWDFNITSIEGPGCTPVMSNGFYTRTTFGANTVDGSEIYYWYAAYPDVGVTVNETTPESHTWCETTILYQELTSNSQPASDYRFRLNKNGTSIIAVTDLDKGVTAKWKFTYTSGENKFVNALTLNGPVNDLPYGRNLNTPVSEEDKPVPFSDCGTGSFKIRTDLTLTANDKGAKGTVRGETIKGVDGIPYNYGAQVGWSYDWQKCAK